MRCKKCKKRNVIQANYCIKCGNRFSDIEKNNSKKRSILKELLLTLNIKIFYIFTVIFTFLLTLLEIL